MTQQPLVSVVVVSHERPRALRRCLLSILQQYHRPLEVVVVADSAACRFVEPLAAEAGIVLLPFDEAKISEARNRGIAAAHGAFIAFIDDDSAAEPIWVQELLRGFDLPGVQAVGGYVLGRNGISYQWTARAVAPDGGEMALAQPSREPFVAHPPEGWAAKTQGTNCAFRSEALLGVGGFDPAFRYFNDETDLNLRMARAGMLAAFAPGALVHHGYFANRTRRADRAPRDLFEIGRSQAILLRKHLPQPGIDQALGSFVAGQRKRLIAHMVSGALAPHDVGRLLSGLSRGIDEGLRIALAPRNGLPAAPGQPVLLATPPPRRAIALAGHWSQRAGLEARAAAARQAGDVVTLFRFSAIPLRHHATFRDDGVWLQTGGIFGKSQREVGMPATWRIKRRAALEKERIRRQRWPEKE
ncbi:Putative glycosyltransferase EpsH [Pseudoruegeria aquimaris]|uniref:Putative glycosyltransferase EpsH n=1 Tax=Pseudoruegeria aquimaris TaxID=393663 RepID=A0A1Y5RUZ3_9RHOB|nr:glycosyltransferase [Pseudoruegeria aquimaris]SLN25095.1 Putative glycosyltransferase EpsH [Pseudoruegeria aquimaris]